MITWPKPDEYGYDTNGFKKRMQNIMVGQIVLQNKENQTKSNIWTHWLQKGLHECSPAFLKELIREGVPDSLRKRVWPLLVRIDVPSYQKISSQPFDQKISKVIDLDLERTFPTNVFFMKSNSCYQSLRKVLNSLSTMFPEMGYCQGLNFIVATVLLRLPENEAFGLCYYILRGLGHGKLLVDVKRVKIDLFVLDRLIQKHFKRLYNHLRAYQVESILYAASWFITLYCGCLPFEYNLRIIQLYLSEGKKILFRVALAIIKIKKQRTKRMNSFQDILMHLKNLNDIQETDPEEFLKQMFSFSISRKEIESYEDMYSPDKAE